MPDSLEGLSAGVQIQLQQSDPDLFALLAGTASAELELAALSNQLGDAAPTAQQRQDAETKARIEAILEAGNPYGQQGYYEADGTYVPPVPGNVTTAFELESLDPEMAERLKAAASPAPALTPSQQRDQQIIAAYTAQPAGV